MTADEQAAGDLSHHGIRERWGQPQEHSGSVNDPRVYEEHGLRFNEKWVYHLPDGSRRMVYWQRYDFLAALIEHPDGVVTLQPL